MLRVVIVSALLVASPVGQTEPLDRVTVTVDDKLVLLSEERLEHAIASIDVSPSPFWAPDRQSARERLVEAAVIRIMAADVAIYQPPQAEVRERLEAVRLRIEQAGRDHWRAFMREHGLDEDGFTAVLKRRLIVERYLSRNLHVTGDVDPQRWASAYEKLLRDLRPRTRVRYVGER